MSQPPRQPPSTSGPPASGPLSVQSILNPSSEQTTSRRDGTEGATSAQRPGSRRRTSTSASQQPVQPGAGSTLPIHPSLPPPRSLPPIRAEPGPSRAFSPGGRYGQTPVSYAPLREGQTGRPGDFGGQPGRSLPMPSGLAPMIPEHPEPQGYAQGLPPGTQMYVYETPSGTLQIPVEVQAASRQADEKRKRNAGASARFRQRRKERESASSQEIDELRRQVQDLEEDVAYYRSERDYLLPLVYDRNDRESHVPRPPSPRRRRTSRPSEAGPSPPYPPSALYGRPSPAYEERGERASEERHTRRRLTQQEYGPPAAQPPYGYGPAPPSQPLYREELPPLAYDPRRPPEGTILPPLQPPQHREREYQDQPPDPYRRDWPPPPPPPPPPAPSQPSDRRR